MKLLRSASGFALILAFAAQLSAGPILVGTWEGSSGNAAEKVAIRSEISDYNAANNPDLPQIFGAGSDPSLINSWMELGTNAVSSYFNSGDDKTINWTANLGYSEYYVMTKWGQGQANFDHVLHYLLAGENLTYNPGGSGPPNGLSHLRIFARGGSTTVPDGGMTLGLLGLGMAVIGGVRRFVRR